MKIKLLVAAGFIAVTALSSGCVVAPPYGAPGYYGPAVVVAPGPVYRGGYYGGYYGHGYYRRY